MEPISGAIGRSAVFTRARMGEHARKKLFADLWNHFYPRLRVFIARMLADEADLDDAIQEVMFKVYCNLLRYRPDYAVGTWIYTIARNHCIDRIRAAMGVTVTTGIIDADTLVSGYPTPEESYVRQEELQDITNRIRRLRPADRQIAFLHFFESMPYRQISTVLGMPVGTIKYRVHRIRRILTGGEKEEM